MGANVSEQVNEFTDMYAIEVLGRWVKQGTYTNGDWGNVIRAMQAYAAEVRAALQDEHEHAKAEAYLNGREFERARWEGEVKEAIDLLDKFQRVNMTAVGLRACRCRNNLAALLKDAQ